jgi:Ca2+-binding RTX toxin-like protein
MAIVYGTTNSDLLNAADGITFGDDDVYGGDGNDTIYGLGGNDNLFGEDGRDKLYGSIGNDWLDGGKNHDDLFGGNNDDVLFGGAGDDELYGENNDDYLDGGAGADLLDGGDGDRDWAAYYGSGEGVHVSLNPFLLIGGNSGGDAEGDILVNIEFLVGTRYGDELYGNDQANLVYGMEGNDALVGDGGDDQLEGGAGNDVLDGGDGADYMRGGTGNDHYFVNHAGDVVIEYTDEGLDTDHARIDGDHVEDLEDEGIDTVNARTDYTLGDHVENLVLLAGGGVNGTGNDGDNGIAGNELSNLLNGGGGADTLKGAGGDDFLDGGTGADTMLGGEGGDIFIVDDAGDVVTEHADEGFDMLQTTVSYSLAAGSEVEVLYADPATTTAAINLTGNEFDNFLTGNDGINVLVGGLGLDTLRGFGGGDAFLWSSVAEVGLSSSDVVADYSIAQGDVLHFTGIDADETVAGDQNFVFIGAGAFTAPGQINWFSNGTDTFIQLNTNADLAADGIIQLSGVLSGDSVLMFL